MNEKIQPCDKMIIPIYQTYIVEKGIVCEKEMFEGSRYIVLRWHEGRKDHERLVYQPHAWYNDKNYWDIGRGAWRYG